MDVHSVLRGITEASQPQLPASGPSGQPIESSHLASSPLARKDKTPGMMSRKAGAVGDNRPRRFKITKVASLRVLPFVQTRAVRPPAASANATLARESKRMASKHKRSACFVG